MAGLVLVGTVGREPMSRVVGGVEIVNDDAGGGDVG